MVRAVIFDLDQTLLDSSVAEPSRKARNWNEVYRLIPEFNVYEGIHELIEWTGANCKSAVVTSAPSTYCNRVLHHHRWNFDAVVCYHDTARHKPYPDPIAHASRLLGIPPGECVSIGDRDIDVIASKAASTYSILATWGTLLTIPPNCTPDKIFRNPAELLSWLRSNIRPSENTHLKVSHRTH